MAQNPPKATILDVISHGNGRATFVIQFDYGSIISIDGDINMPKDHMVQHIDFWYEHVKPKKPEEKAALDAKAQSWKGFVRA